MIDLSIKNDFIQRKVWLRLLNAKLLESL